MIQMRIDQHLIIPFGRPKWDISKIKLCGVSTGATYFESDTPCVYIDKTKGTAIRFENLRHVFPEPEKFPDMDDGLEAFDFVIEHMKRDCCLQTDSEGLFLELYARYCKNEVTPSESQLKYHQRKELSPPSNDDDWVFAALIPLPQAHLYLEDPLAISRSFNPTTMVKVDFAFWTGKQIVAVEIDGESHIGSESHIKKDRLLSRAGVNTIHILNSELKEHKTKVVSRLLPASITQFWKDQDRAYNPLSSIPF